jgi:hypothetical protein
MKNKVEYKHLHKVVEAFIEVNEVNQRECVQVPLYERWGLVVVLNEKR